MAKMNKAERAAAAAAARVAAEHEALHVAAMEALDANAAKAAAVVADAVPAVAGVSAEAAAAVVAASVDSKRDEAEALGNEVALADEGAGDYFRKARALGLLPDAQGDTESGEAYNTRCKAFEAPKPLMQAFLRGYVKRAALRTTKAFSLFVENETTGQCRDAVEGDNPAKVRNFAPLDCYLMDKETFKALPGKAEDGGTVKGRVSGSRVSMQGLADVRKSRLLSDGVDEGRRVEAATGTKAARGRGANATLAAKAAAFFKSGVKQTQAQGTDKALAFKAAFGTFVDDLVTRKVITRDEWKAATGTK